MYREFLPITCSRQICGLTRRQTLFARHILAGSHRIASLLSALQFHGLTTQAPFEVWLAIDEKARLPKVEYPPLRVARFSGPALRSGIKEHRIEGVAVQDYIPANA